MSKSNSSLFLPLPRFHPYPRPHPTSTPNSQLSTTTSYPKPTCPTSQFLPHPPYHLLFLPRTLSGHPRPLLFQGLTPYGCLGLRSPPPQGASSALTRNTHIHKHFTFSLFHSNPPAVSVRSQERHRGPKWGWVAGSCRDRGRRRRNRARPHEILGLDFPRAEHPCHGGRH
jgi:hypothetical protein